MEALQDNTSTSIDRYPELMHPLIRWLSARGEGAKALSFGCSDGSELAMLSMLAPEAELVGVDVDESALGRAKVLFSSHRRVEILRSEWDGIRDRGPFDLILANSVFCRHPLALDTADFRSAFPFALFEDSVGRLVSSLHPDGVLMLTNSNYPVQSSDLGLTPIETPSVAFSGFVPKFGADSRKWCQSDGNSLQPFFWARADSCEIALDLLRDVLFTRSPSTRAEVARLFALPEFADLGGTSPLVREMVREPKTIGGHPFIPLNYRLEYRPVRVGGQRRVWRGVVAAGEWGGDGAIIGQSLLSAGVDLAD